jgi:hypothetical protein
MTRKSVVCTEHECHGWTDKFQFFFLSVCTMSRMDRQVSVISVQFQFSFLYSQVSLSVRTEVQPKKEEKMLQRQTQETQDPIGGSHSMAKFCS